MGSYTYSCGGKELGGSEGGEGIAAVGELSPSPEGLRKMGVCGLDELDANGLDGRANGLDGRAEGIIGGGSGLSLS